MRETLFWRFCSTKCRSGFADVPSLKMHQMVRTLAAALQQPADGKLEIGTSTPAVEASGQPLALMNRRGAKCQRESLGIRHLILSPMTKV